VTRSAALDEAKRALIAGLRLMPSFSPGAFVSQLRHCTPVSVSRDVCSFRFGRASAMTIPRRVHAIRQKAGTTTSYSMIS
jgi:hypothetical protein